MPNASKRTDVEWFENNKILLGRLSWEVCTLIYFFRPIQTSTKHWSEIMSFRNLKDWIMEKYMLSIRPCRTNIHIIGNSCSSLSHHVEIVLKKFEKSELQDFLKQTDIKYPKLIILHETNLQLLQQIQNTSRSQYNVCPSICRDMGLWNHQLEIDKMWIQCFGPHYQRYRMDSLYQHKEFYKFFR